MTARKIVTGHAQMWPRGVFDVRVGNRLPEIVRTLLDGPGVYVLYRDDHPYYIGKTSKVLFNRIWHHANRPRDRYYNFWNFFSAFVVARPDLIDEVEAILIAAGATANHGKPKIPQIKLPATLTRLIHEQRVIKANRA